MAVEANPSLLRQHAAVTLARQAAMREVKRHRQKQGIKGSLPFSTLSRLAIEWLRDHPQLLAEAAASPLCTGYHLRTAESALSQRQISVHTSRAKWRRAMIVGYARVSPDGQTLDAQQSALRAAGAEKIFSKKISGTVTDRKALARAIAELGPRGLLACYTAG
jgi:hypothetical protein